MKTYETVEDIQPIDFINIAAVREIERFMGNRRKIIDGWKRKYGEAEEGRLQHIKKQAWRIMDEAEKHYPQVQEVLSGADRIRLHITEMLWIGIVSEQ